MACRHSFGGYDEARFEQEVDSKLLCPVCYKVLKEPVQCPNEHYLCGSCFRKHLHENSETCPVCQEHVTEETLTKPPRILLEFLLSLKIRCDHAERGCPELMKLEFLQSHVVSCGYVPTPCTHSGCSQVINQRDKQRHITELCHFRTIVCEECGEEVVWKLSRVHHCFMRKETDDMAKRLNIVEKDMSEVKEDVKQVTLTQEEFIKEVRSMMARAVNEDDVDELRLKNERMKLEMNAMRAEIECFTKQATERKKEEAERNDLFTGRQKIYVCGGWGVDDQLHSVETYSWPENTWTSGPAMKRKRSGHSAFVHDRQIFVTGGRSGGTKITDSIERLKVNEQDMKWNELPVLLPAKFRGHKIVSHENSAIVTGGYDGKNASDRVYQMQMNPPYSTKLLTRIPEPTCYHGCQIINNKIVIAGVSKSMAMKDTESTIYLLDINTNEHTQAVSLPFAVAEVASVSYKGNVILIGGCNPKGETSDKVIMYDVKTGRSKMLPNLCHKRSGAAAVITGNVIIVMGGFEYETRTILSSVECLDLNTPYNNVWRELSSMTIKRSYAAATVQPM